MPQNKKSNQDRSIDLTSIGGLKFIESTHTYYNKDNKRYNGVTTLLKRYEHEFDSEFGSLNSAIKHVIIENFGELSFNGLKKQCKDVGLLLLTEEDRELGNAKFVYGHNYLHTKLESIIKKYPKLESDIYFHRDRFLKEWKEISNESLRIGSLEHDEREQLIIRDGYYSNGIHYKYDKNKNIMNITSDDVIVIPECLFWNHDIELGGLSDIALFNKGEISIEDYKTNEKIEMVSFNERKMKGVCNSLMDSNYFHYSLQLEIYLKMALMLRPDLKRGSNNKIISTKSEKYNRSEDNIIECFDVKNEVEMIFKELTLKK